MARALFAKPPTEKELAQMASLGLTLDDIDPVEVWPDNLPAMRLLIVLGRSWRFSFGGPVGLDYAALVDPVWKRAGIRKRARDEVFADLQVMEVAALNEMRKK